MCLFMVRKSHSVLQCVFGRFWAIMELCGTGGWAVIGWIPKIKKTLMGFEDQYAVEYHHIYTLSKEFVMNKMLS